jgi:hypothetical protein
MRRCILAAALLFVGVACCPMRTAADRDAMRRGVCWQAAQLARPVPVDCNGEPLTGDRLEQRRALVEETRTRLGIDCTDFRP